MKLTGSESDVLGKQSGIDVYVYDRSHETFLGYAKVDVNVTDHSAKQEGWYRLEKRNAEDDSVTGEIRLEFSFQKTDKKVFGPEDFQILRLIGKGKQRVFLGCSSVDTPY